MSSYEASGKSVSLALFEKKNVRPGSRAARRQEARAAKPSTAKEPWFPPYYASTIKKMDEALVRLKARGKTAQMAVPLDLALLRDYVIVGHGLMVKGGMTLARFAGLMEKTIGPEVKIGRAHL